MVFGIWIILMASRMPMKATYGGVQNTWYVSPALFPLIIGSAIIILSILLLIHSTKAGGAKTFFREMASGGIISEKSLRFWIMIVLFISTVYLYIPRIDFFLSVVLFLLVFISIFYFDEIRLMIRLFLFYVAITILLLLLFIFRLDTILNRSFVYFTDSIILIFIIFFIIYCRILIKKNRQLIQKFRLILLVSFSTPLILCPVFKYLLLVPLPKEGGIIYLFNIIRYSLL